MSFWLRNIILGLFLVVLAWAFLANQDLLFSLETSLQEEETTETATQTEKKEKPEKYQQGAESENAAARGLSKFYANLHGDMSGKGPRIRNNIVYLPDLQGSLNELLQARELVVRPYKKSWVGTVQSRPFRPGETLNQKLTEFLDKEGVSLFWWINRDYVVKDAFRIKKDLLKTSYQVAKAIEGHFPSGLSIFFCYRQRAVVVIESAPHPFLDEDCIAIKNKQGY